MKRDNGNYYFDNFVACADCSFEAAKILKETLDNFDINTLSTQMSKLHAIENKGDNLKHEMMSQLVKAFITPIERDDILQLSQTIDDVTDSVEDILIHIYTNNITAIRNDISQFCDLLIHCCSTMKEMLVEFKNFKKADVLNEFLISINALEESGDEMYIKAQKKLHSVGANPLSVISWHEIYDNFEICFDACEHVADIVEWIIIRNT